jgi:glycerol kinase
MVANNWTMQFLADILDIAVERPAVTETTALGAAAMAGLQVGFWESQDEFAKHWQLDRRFTPTMSATEREERYAGWRQAVGRVLS